MPGCANGSGQPKAFRKGLNRATNTEESSGDDERVPEGGTQRGRGLAGILLV